MRLLACVLLCVGCAVPFPYVSRTAGSLAHVWATGSNITYGRIKTEGAIVDVYDLESGCPDLDVRMKSRGYRGSARLNAAQTVDLVVPAGRRVVLRGDWNDPGVFTIGECQVAVSFIPESQTTYSFRFTGAANTDHCTAAIAKIVEDPAGSRHLEPVRTAIYPKHRLTTFGRAYPELCQLTP